MAKKRVPVKPLQQSLGEDFDEEDLLNNLAYLAPNSGNPQFDVGGTAMPPVSADQQYEDVPRQMAEREPSWWDKIVKYVENEQPPPQEEFTPEDTQGLEMLRDYGDELDQEMPQEEPQVDEMEALSGLAEGDQPPMQAQEQEVYEIPTDEQGKLVSPLEVIRQSVEADPELMEMLPEQTRQLLMNPDSPLAQHQLEEAQEMSTPTPGGYEAGSRDPNVISVAERMDGLTKGEGYPPQVQEKAEMWENIFYKELQNLDNEESQLIERAQNDSLTTDEMVGLGLATLLPALLGLFYGKEAALGAIGGGLKASGEFLGQKQKGAQEAKTALGKIDQKRIDLLDKDSKFRKEFMDQIEDPKLRKLVKDKGWRTFEEDGKVGIPVNEDLNVYLDASMLTDDEDVSQWRKDWDKERELFGAQKEFNDSMQEMRDILLAVKDQNPNMYQIMMANKKGKIPNALRDLFGEGAVPYVTIVRNGERHRVNALQALEQATKRFQSSYIKVNKFENRLTDNLKDHMEGIFSNPNDPNSWMGADAQDFIDKLDGVINLSNRFFVEGQAAKGYLKEPLRAQYPFEQTRVINQKEEEQLVDDVEQGNDKYMDYVVR